MRVPAPSNPQPEQQSPAPAAPTDPAVSTVSATVPAPTLPAPTAPAVSTPTAESAPTVPATVCASSFCSLRQGGRVQGSTASTVSMKESLGPGTSGAIVSPISCCCISCYAQAMLHCVGGQISPGTLAFVDGRIAIKASNYECGIGLLSFSATVLNCVLDIVHQSTSP